VLYSSMDRRIYAERINKLFDKCPSEIEDIVIANKDAIKFLINEELNDSCLLVSKDIEEYPQIIPSADLIKKTGLGSAPDCFCPVIPEQLRISFSAGFLNTFLPGKIITLSRICLSHLLICVDVFIN